MKSFGRFLVVLLLLGNLLFLAALSLHVVRSPGKLAVLPKSQLTLIETYANTTDWTTVQMTEHPAVVARLVQSGRGAMLSHVTSVSVSAVTPREAGKRIPAARPAAAPAQKPAGSEEPRAKSIFDIPGQN